MIAGERGDRGWRELVRWLGWLEKATPSPSVLMEEPISPHKQGVESMKQYGDTVWRNLLGQKRENIDVSKKDPPLCWRLS